MRIGRGDDQDVQIDDEHVSRENHAYVIYDPLNCEFLLAPGDGRGLVYLSKNKQKPELVAQPRKLDRFDTIIIGKTHLFFVPFCEPSTFQWQPADQKSGQGGRPDTSDSESQDSPPSAFSQRKPNDSEW